MGHQDDGRAGGPGAASVSSYITRSPLSESRAPVGSSAKITLGGADQRAGDRDPLALSAGDLTGPLAADVLDLQALIHSAP
ncbi:hypothetical protein SGLAM104S_10485 [Streptomyces glaucescens]